ANRTAIYSAEAPANIALIKYMGKVTGDGARNLPTNRSFSFTLNNLKSRVEIIPLNPQATTYDAWAPLIQPGYIETKLSDSGRRRYVAHFEFLKQKLDITGFYEVRSGNTFMS